MIQIVRAQKTDVADILNFIRELAEYERLSHEVVATEETLTRTLFGPQAFAEVVFIEDGGERVGFALYFHNYSTFLAKPGIYLEDLYVKPDRRGKGYGRKLFNYLAQTAVERGCGRLEWSVLDWNTPALNFYAALGAQPMSEWRVQRLTGEALLKVAKGEQ